MGNCACVPMHGHGSTVAGGSIEQAMYRAVYAELNAKLQAEGMKLGEVSYLTEKEGSLAAASNDSQTGRAWALWTRELESDHE